VSFVVRLTKKGRPVGDVEIQWTLSKDGVPPAKSGKVKLNAEGSGIVTGQLDEPGFLQLRASFNSPEKTSTIALGGAAIDPLLIKPSMPVPDDFDEFWAAQKKTLDAVPVNARLTSVPSP